MDPRSGNEILPTPETLRKLAKAYDYPYLDLAEIAGIITDKDRKAALELSGYIDIVRFCELLADRISDFPDLRFLDELKIKYPNLLEDSFEFSRESLEQLGQELKKSGTYEEIRSFVDFFDDAVKLCSQQSTRYPNSDIYHAVIDPLSTYKGIHLKSKERSEIINFIEYLVHRRESQ